MNGEDIDQPDEGKDPQHLLLRRGQQQLTPRLPGQVPAAHQRGQAAGIDELQACQIDDDLRAADRDRGERDRDTSGLRHVKLPPQRDDNLTVAFAGTQIHTSHPGRLPASAARRGPDPAANYELSLPTVRRIPVRVPSG